MSTRFFLKITIPLVIMFLLAACNLAGAPTPTQESPNVLYTAAAQTIVAQITQASSGNATPTSAQPTVEPTNPPTATQAPTATQEPTATQAPTATLTPLPTNTQVPTATKPQPTATKVTPTLEPLDTSCYRAAYVEDVNYPDGTDVYIGTTIYKTWRLKNTGTCTWNEDYSLVFVSGNAMGQDETLSWDWGDVPRNHTVDITIAFQVPDKAGKYKSEWKIENPKGQVFGITKSSGNVVPFYVSIEAIKPTIGFDFISKAPKAIWRTATGSVPFGRKEREPATAMIKDSLRLEDGLTYGSVLMTYPENIQNGIITGLFPAYTVHNKDQFMADFGFRYEAGGSVKMSLRYVENGTETILKEWTKNRDGELDHLKVDLSSLAGKTVQFMLVVTTNGDPLGDLAVWVNPRIQR